MKKIPLLEGNGGSAGMIHNLFEVKMSHSSADDGLDFGALLTCPMPKLCKSILY